MLDRRELLALAAASAGMASSARGAPAHRGTAAGMPRAASRKGEVQALRTFAEATHPRGREARDDPAWRQSWSKLERVANRLPDGSYFVEMRRALAWFEDGHSTVLPFEFLGKVPDAFSAGPFGLHLPWRVKLFDDGARIVATDDSGQTGLGARIDQVGSLSTITLMRALNATWPGNRAWAQNWGGSVFGSLAQLQGLGAMRDPRAPLAVRLSDTNGPTSVDLQPARAAPALSNEVVRTKGQRELWADDVKRGNYVRVLRDRRAIYVSIDDMDDVEGATFEQLTRDSFAAIDSSAADRLVIDLRRNGGGNNFLGEPLRKHIERSSFNRPGRLFVLVGPATFSAAQNLANRLERETYAIFLGGPTGLAPNHYGDAKLFTGPATGLTAMVSTLPWFDSYPQDTREWVMPDVVLTTTFDDWQAGRDPALDAAFTHASVGSSDDLSRDRIFYYRRASQKQEWKPFWA